MGSMTVETIKPLQAERMLQMNTGNRPVSRTHVSALAAQMRRNTWNLNYEAIKISKTGVLLDGQHRLMACVESGTAFQTAIVRDVDDSVFGTLDTGKKRSASDVLSLSGEKYAMVISGALRLLEILSKDEPDFCLSVPNQRILELLELHPGIRAWAATGQDLAKVMRPVQACCLGYLFSKKSPEMASEFFARIKDGARLYPGHPILVLRERLLREGSAKAKLPRSEYTALVIKAWNDFKHSKNTKLLRWGKGEPFPKIK